MSLELALVGSVSSAMFLLTYIAFKLKDRHSSIRMLLTNVSLLFGVAVMYTGMRLARQNAYDGIAQVFTYLMQANVVIFVLVTFYMIWLYLKATGKVVSGNKNQFDNMDEQ